MSSRVALLVLTSLSACATAHAHAHLVTSAPAEGSVLDAPPASLMFTFSESARVTARFVQKDQEPKYAPRMRHDSAVVGLRSCASASSPCNGRGVLQRILHQDHKELSAVTVGRIQACDRTSMPIQKQQLPKRRSPYKPR